MLWLLPTFACEPSTEALVYLHDTPTCLVWEQVGDPQTAGLTLHNTCDQALSLRSEPFSALEPCPGCDVEVTLAVDGHVELTLDPPPGFIGSTPWVLTWADGSHTRIRADVYGFEEVLCPDHLGAEASTGCATAPTGGVWTSFWRR